LKASKALNAGKIKSGSRTKSPSFKLAAKSAAAVGAAVLVLGAIYWLNLEREGGRTGKYKFQVGSPGPGEVAPPIRLDANLFGDFDLATLRGKTVLLYFQEGLTCQPCWDQLKDIEKNPDDFRALGIDTIVSITTDPVNLVLKKTADEAIRTPILSDPDLAVSKSYGTNSYGMMGDSRNGHTFVVVGPDGRILWRADYGGAPDYTMYLPVPDLLADLRHGLGKAGS